MYLPRSIISHLYLHLLRTHHPLSPPVLLLVALEPDALCACRILTALLKRDYIPHKIQPIAGHGDLTRIGEELVQPMRTTDGGSGGVVVCLGVGGLVDLEAMLGLETDENGEGGTGNVEVWVLDARRPWNLANVFGAPPGDDAQNGGLVRGQLGVDQGRISQSYKPGRGGIIVFDDGDIEEELGAERNAYCALAEMPEVDEDDDETDGSDSESEDGEKEPPVSGQAPKKRKSWADSDDESEEEHEDGPPRQRRRSNSVSSTRTPYQLYHLPFLSLVQYHPLHDVQHGAAFSQPLIASVAPPTSPTPVRPQVALHLQSFLNNLPHARFVSVSSSYVASMSLYFVNTIP